MDRYASDYLSLLTTHNIIGQQRAREREKESGKGTNTYAHRKRDRKCEKLRRVENHKVLGVLITDEKGIPRKLLAR